MVQHYLAWWNVENLFNVKNDPDRSEKLERTLGSELDGWTAPVLTKKLHQLGSLIRQMNGGIGPDILGVCEVENAKVLDKLIAQLSLLGRAYAVVHADSQDNRGIDVAFIYDAAKYDVNPDEVFNHFILRRNATRDLLHASVYTKPDGHRLVLIGNHGPSRSGGEASSEPYRIMAAETLAYFHERILEENGEGQSIVVMGDFNDEPFNRSLLEYALSERQERRVKSLRTRNPYLLNLTWPLMGLGLGTHYYSGLPGMLDQILVNRPLLRDNSAIQIDLDSFEILAFPEMVASGGSPKRFGRPSSPSSFDDQGFSDHFPIAVTLNEQ